MLSTLLEKTDPARRRVGTAIVFAVFYCVMAEYYKSITLWQGPPSVCSCGWGRTWCSCR